MKEWNTRVLCDVTETSRDGAQNPAPPLRASGVLPANAGSVGRRALLCSGRGNAGLLGSPLPTSGCRAHTSLWRPLPGRSADTILVPLASESRQRKPHTPCARERCPWSARGRPPAGHRSPAPGRVNARAGPRSARLRVPQPRSCAARTGRHAQCPPRCPGNGGEWRTLSAGVALGFRSDVRSSRGPGFCSPVTELFVFLWSPSR